MTWPSFIAAPFIVPSTATICSAVSTWRRASAASLASSPRARFAARVPNWRTACPAARRPIVAERTTREVGMFSRGIWLVRCLHSRAGDDVVRAVGPANPGLVAAVVVGPEQDQRRRIAERDAEL